MDSTNSRTLFSLQFLLLCLSSFLFFASFNMIIPELPDYLENLGGGEYKGLIISVFTITAGLSRPFSGKLADTIGRIPVMIFGAVVCFLVGFLYPVLGSVAAFMLLRLVHGFSTGFKPTGTAAYVADVVPNERRGEAMGVLGIAGSLGMAAGPAIGSEIAMRFSMETMFYTSSFSALLSVIVLAGMKETLKKRVKFSFRLLRIHPAEVLEPRVFAPSALMMLTAFPFGIILTLIPDLSVHLGFENKGTFFTALTLSSVLIRFFAGKASDKFGRVAVLKISTIWLAISLVAVAFAGSKEIFLLAAVFTGIAFGMNTPTIFAWTVDLSDPDFRGRAMSTMFIALEIGIGFGALISGWVYSNNVANLPVSFLLGSVTSFMAFLYIQFYYKPKKDLRNENT